MAALPFIAMGLSFLSGIRGAQAEQMNANAQADAMTYNAKTLENQANAAQAQANSARYVLL